VPDRRNFLKTAALAAGGAASFPLRSLSSRYQTSTGTFVLHQFIENNPDAVFIMKTSVDVKTNSDAKKSAGMAFARSVLLPSDSGMPLTNLIPIKPNLTSFNSAAGNVVNELGILTDVYFVEGIIEGMKELGLAGNQFYINEANYASFATAHGWDAMGVRTGAFVGKQSQVVWIDAPNGIWFRRIPYFYPENTANSFYLNVAKFKAHGMGLTLCAKNLQGSIANNYHTHCDPGKMDTNMAAADKNPNRTAEIQANFNRHLAAGVPRWDRPSNASSASTWNYGLGMESWASRCVDNNMYSKVGLHIIEGIYGREGNFLTGPYPVNGGTGTPDLTRTSGGYARDIMTNILIFGKKSFHVDIIGEWLGGHEPGNLGLFHLAHDKGLMNYFNPQNVPLYEWTADGQAVRKSLTDFTRTPLLTYYLRKNYITGQTAENYWHYVNEPFDYSSVKVNEPAGPDRPGAFLLGQNNPNPFNPYTSIEYQLPSAGTVRLEVFNGAGQIVDVLADGTMSAGKHLATWKTSGQASGTYYYRLRFGEFTETKKMTLLK
jgi:hypothetical protein